VNNFQNWETIGYDTYENLFQRAKDLSEQLGQELVLMWPITACPFCQSYLNSYDQFYRVKDDKIIVVETSYCNHDVEVYMDSPRPPARLWSQPNSGYPVIVTTMFTLPLSEYHLLVRT
jgi:hypothetical protein